MNSLLRRRARVAGSLVRRIRQSDVPPAHVRVVYPAILVVYFAKRLVQDLVARNLVLSRYWLMHRWRDIETNFLIRLVVWRDAPIDRPFNMYDAYTSNNRLTAAEASRMRAHAADFPHRPLISIVVPVHNASEQWIERLVQSVLDQTYDRWELVLVDDGSSDEHTWKHLLDASRQDDRITIHRLETNQGVVHATNRAVEISNGEWIAFADHDDELTPDALWWIAKTLHDQSDVDVIYTDEEIVDDKTGSRYPHLKPGFSPQQLTAFNYICHLLVVRRDLFEEVGRLRAGTDGAQDFDLVLRLAEQTEAFVHIPRVLYRWHLVERSMSRHIDQKTGSPRAVESLDGVTQRVVQEHFERLGIPGTVAIEHHWARPVFPPVDHGKVTLIICTKDQPARLQRCLRSIETKTDYPNYEILIVDNASITPRARNLLEQIARRHRVVTWENGPEGFNFSRLNNRAAKEVTGKYLVFLNDDTEVVSPGWLSAMVGTAQFPRVGAVGARLLYPSGLNQHAGLVVGALGWGPWHALMGIPANFTPYLAYLRFPHNCSAVTGACLLTPRELFLEVGGFEEIDLAVSFSDVDYCLRLTRRGLRSAYCPQAELIHEEGASRGRYALPNEVVAMKSRWQGYQDLYWNGNYSRLSPHFSLDPRRQSRGLGIVDHPKVRYIAAPADLESTPASESLARLERAGRLDRVDDTEGTPDVVVIDGQRGAAIVEEWAEKGVNILWSIPERAFLPERPMWSDRRDILHTVEALRHPYQNVFSNPYDVGWLTAGMPRSNLFLVADPGRTTPPVTEGLRERFGLRRENLLLVAVVDAQEPLSASFLLGVHATLPESLREQSFLVVALDGTLPDTKWRILRRAVTRAGSRTAIIAYSTGLEREGDIVLAHSTISPRPRFLLRALEAKRAVIGTPLIVAGDLIHPPISGRVARAFDSKGWRQEIQALLTDASLRLDLGRQGAHWRDSRESSADADEHWRKLIVEAAELSQANRLPLPAPHPGPTIPREVAARVEL